MLPIEHSVQTYDSSRCLARKIKPLENQIKPCKPMLQILQTYA